jgi:hypothetical protein
MAAVDAFLPILPISYALRLFPPSARACKIMSMEEQSPPEADQHLRPTSALELAGGIVGFARSLSADQQLLASALRIARDAIESDYLFSTQHPRG